MSIQLADQHAAVPVNSMRALLHYRKFTLTLRENLGLLLKLTVVLLYKLNSANAKPMPAPRKGSEENSTTEISTSPNNSGWKNYVQSAQYCTVLELHDSFSFVPRCSCDDRIGSDDNGSLLK